MAIKFRAIEYLFMTHFVLFFFFFAFVLTFSLFIVCHRVCKLRGAETSSVNAKVNNV